MTYFKDENRKMLRLSWNFNHSFLSLFQELIILGNFLLSLALLKSYHREEQWFSSYKKLKIIFFYKFDKAWIWDPKSGSVLRF
jgi:hypothetical protein